MNRISNSELGQFEERDISMGLMGIRVLKACALQILGREGK